jgi:hypothetical protein
MGESILHTTGQGLFRITGGLRLDFSIFSMFPDFLLVKDKRNMQQCTRLGCARDRTSFGFSIPPIIIFNLFPSVFFDSS